MPLATLAQLTSLVILVVFAMVNSALWWLETTHPMPGRRAHGGRWVPLIAALTCVALLMLRAVAALL